MGIYLFIGIIITIVQAIKMMADMDWTDIVDVTTESEEDLNIVLGSLFIAGVIVVMIWPAAVICDIYGLIKNKIES